MAVYESSEILCPFYRDSGRKGKIIRCEGVGNARTTTLTYRSERQRIRQMEIFCQKCYTNC